MKVPVHCFPLAQKLFLPELSGNTSHHNSMKALLRLHPGTCLPFWLRLRHSLWKYRVALCTWRQGDAKTSPAHFKAVVGKA